jgi:DNA-binding response OmpR family regulator
MRINQMASFASVQDVRVGPLQSLSDWRCRILIVDDDEIVRAQLRRLLRLARFDVHVAGSAHEALHVLGALHFHIVLTDWQMPDMDGLELCRRIRTGLIKSDVYIMVLTVRGTPNDTVRCLVAGADDHLIKNSTNKEILSRMEIARRVAHSAAGPGYPADRVVTALTATG